MNYTLDIKEKYFSYKSLFFLLICLFFFTLYSLLLSCHYGFDSIELTIWSTKGYFFQAEHMLETFLRKLFYDMCKSLGYAGGALVPQQLLDSFFGCIGLGFFFLTLTELLKNNFISIVSTLGLGFSKVYWAYSREVETHIMPTAILILCFFFLFKIGKAKRTLMTVLIIAILHGVSILFSEAYILFLPAFVFGIFLKTARDRSRTVAIYTIPVLTIYILSRILYLFIQYKADFTYAISPYLYEYLITNLKKLDPAFLKINLLKVIYSRFVGALLERKLNSALLLLFISPLYLLILNIFLNAKVILNRYKKEFFICLFFLLSFLPFIALYEPYNTQRYTPLLVPLWIILAISLNNLAGAFQIKSLKVILPLAMIAVLFMVNLFGFIIPTRNPLTNEALQRSLILKNKTKLGDLIIFVGAGRSTLDSMYIIYFAEREPFSFYRFYTAHNAKEFVVYEDTNLLKALKKRIDLKLNNNNNIFAYGEIFTTDRQYATLYGFNWPIENKKIASFLLANYKVSEGFKLNDKIIYEIKAK